MRLIFLFQQIKRSLFFYVNPAKTKNPSKPEVFCLFVFLPVMDNKNFFLIIILLQKEVEN